MRAGLNIVVAGGTQAGKTTLLNCLAASIPGHDRVVSVEEVFELRFAHPDWVALQTRQQGLEGTGEVRLRDLVKESLRMRPSRVIVGEVRAEECLDLLLALNAGLPGMASLHANSAREALVKMCTLPLLAGENISARFVVPTVAASVDLVVHLGIDGSGRPPGRGDRRRPRPGRERHHRDRDRVRTARRPAGPRPGDAAARRALRPRRRRRARPAGAGGLTWASRSGSLAGVGLLLVWLALSDPSARASPSARPGRTRQRLDAAGLSGTSVGGVWAVSVVLAVVAFGAVQVLSRTVTVAAAFGVIGGYLPLAVLAGRARRRQRDLAEVWPEAVDNLASAVRAGLSLPEALGQLGERGPEPLREPFRRVRRATTRSPAGSVTRSTGSRTGWPTRSATAWSRRCGSPARSAAASSAACCATCRRSCARTPAPARELESRQAWTVNGARLAVAAPWLVLLMLSFQHDVIVRYASPAGTVVLVGGGVVCLVAYRLMVRVGRLPVERRILS